jgi:hypothetical protein
MALPGSGFLAIWNDVAPEYEADWLHWHTVEHMPERVGVPGFIGGRRYADWSLGHHRLFTLYLGEVVGSFSAPPYLERLNNPTPWTTRLAPHFRNFLRGACHVVASRGKGLGGTVAAIRVGLNDRAKASDPGRARGLVDRLSDLDGLIGAHVGLQEIAVSGVQTKEKALRGDAAAIPFDGVVILEGLSRHEVTAVVEKARNLIGGADSGMIPAETGIYDLSFSLDKKDL